MSYLSYIFCIFFLNKSQCLQSCVKYNLYIFTDSPNLFETVIFTLIFIIFLLSYVLGLINYIENTNLLIHTMLTQIH